MRSLKILKIFFLIFLIISNNCASKKKSVENPYSKLHLSLKKEHQALEYLRKSELQLEKKGKSESKKKLKPLLPTYNPLEEVPIYLSVKDQPLDNVLYIIAKNAGLNLVIEPGITADKLVTATFANVSSAVVLDQLMKAFDLVWEVKNNCLYIKALEEKEFHLDFLNISNDVEIAAGGDVFGASSTGTEEGGEGGTSGSEEFKGKFSVTSTFGKGLGKNSIYKMVLDSVNAIIGKNPKKGEMVTLDPLSGVLYVKTSPSKMRAIEKLIYKLKEKMKKQIVIDAQIIEVVLNDSFNLGIDWSYVGRFLVNDLGLDVNLGWFPKTGLGTYTYSENLNAQKNTFVIIKDPDRSFTEGGKEFRTTISVLKTFGDVKIVSNPHIRVKHAHPALMVSGKTMKYISEISREQTEEGGLVTYTVETSSAFEGIMLGVIPFVINDHTVDLKVFPITSKVDLSKVQTIGDQNINITLPEVEIRNLSTTIRVHNNDVVILGGLIYKNEYKSKSQAPGLGSIPIFGWLFKHKENKSSLSELVVIMHIRII